MEIHVCEECGCLISTEEAYKLFLGRGGMKYYCPSCYHKAMNRAEDVAISIQSERKEKEVKKYGRPRRK